MDEGYVYILFQHDNFYIVYITDRNFEWGIL